MRPIIALFALTAFAVPAGIAYADDAPPVIYSHHWSLPGSANGAVRLDLDTQDVQMRVVPGHTVKVAITIRGDADDKQELIKRYEPTVKSEGNDIVIAAPHHRHSWHWFFSDDSRALVEVALPAGMAVQFKTDTGDFNFDGASDRAPIDGHTDTGDLTIHSAAHRLRLNTDTGDIRVTLSEPAEAVSIGADTGDIHFNGNSRRLKIKTDTGDIAASGTFGDADLGTDTGDIDVRSLRGSLKARTDTGDVTARWEQVTPGTHLEVDSDSGDVTAILPADAHLAGIVSTEGGTLDSDFAGSFNRNHTRLRLSGSTGAVAVRIETDGGDVNLRKRG
ncbi:MAG TPA: DUF4097 family beta strand repeat-containing protein [Gammaproteobacteria bacterium]|nr:DUF4097 family beta strand repeat-containing protein [Gammaproteobacteria bacterium]